MHVAVAVMVKTPGLTPVKTRLAADVGSESAERLFGLSLAVLQHEIQGLLAASPRPVAWNPYWAVHERQACSHPLWSSFPCIWQGEGGLGKKLGHTYSTLKQRYEGVCLIGGDTPQLTKSIWDQAADLLQRHDFVVGPSRDGGFYLVAGRITLPQSLWQGIRYSTSDTCAELLALLREYGAIGQLPVLQDLDYRNDLPQLLAECPPPTVSEPWRQFIDYAKKVCSP